MLVSLLERTDTVKIVTMCSVRAPSSTSATLMAINKKSLSERDICTKFITPALVKAGWDLRTNGGIVSDFGTGGTRFC